MIVQSGIDFEKLLEDNKIKQKRISIPQLYQLLKEELRDLKVEDVKAIQKYVRENSGSASEEIGSKAAEEIDVTDLMNVMMDVSLEFFDKDDAVRQSDSILAPTRYSQ